MKQLKPTTFWDWRYFDVHTVDGYDVVFTLHNRPFMSLFKVAIFDFFVYHNKRRILHYFFTLPLTQEKQQKEPFELHFDDDNYIKEINGGLEICARDARIHLQLRIHSCLPTEHVIRLRLPQSGGDYFAWQLLAPQSVASGTLKWDKQTLSLHGRGYHDRNYGTTHLKKALSGWRWAKFFYKDQLLILGEIYFRQTSKQLVLVQCRQQECHWTQQVLVQRSANRLNIRSDLADFTLQSINEQRIDRTCFLIPTWPPVLRQVEKVRELLAFFTINYKLLQPFRGLFNNARYERYKSVYSDTQKHEVQAFQERIFF